MTRRQRNVLSRISARPRAYAAHDDTSLSLERMGLIRRLDGPKLGRLMAHPVIAWTTTEAGQAALRAYEERRTAAHA
jgi:hypothetical protein